MTWTLDALIPTLDSSVVTLDGSGSALTFQWIPSYDSSQDSEAKLREAKFGDGYSQRAGVGINNIAGTWSLVFNNKSLAEKRAITDFLKAHSDGRSFPWTPYDELSEIKVYCSKWKSVAVDYDTYNVTCTFTRTYGE